jgi:hypothetical protein
VPTLLCCKHGKGDRVAEGHPVFKRKAYDHGMLSQVCKCFFLQSITLESQVAKIKRKDAPVHFLFRQRFEGILPGRGTFYPLDELKAHKVSILRWVKMERQPEDLS